MTGEALAFQDVDASYRRNGGLFGRSATLRALKGISLAVGQGECVGVVGESGSGKTTVGQIAVGLMKPDSGKVIVDGRPAPLDPRARKPEQRRFLQLVPQNPYGSLDPMHTIAGVVAEGLQIHRLCPARQRRERAAAALAEVGLGETFLDRRPHELSGGQRQRVAIARALAVEPEVLILDEPTSALDLLVQAQILNLLLTLQQRRGLSYLLISHDIEVVRHLAHRVYVLAGGEVVEAGPTEEVLRRPRQAYTRRLIEAVPTIEAAT